MKSHLLIVFVFLNFDHINGTIYCFIKKMMWQRTIKIVLFNMQFVPMNKLRKEMGKNKNEQKLALTALHMQL